MRTTLAITLTLLLAASAAAQAPWFKDVAKQVGLEEVKAFRTGFVDLDGDGWLDILIVAAKPTDPAALRAFMNRPGKKGKRTFVETTAESGLLTNRDQEKKGRVTSIFLTGDVNNDGLEDVLTLAECDFEKPKVDRKTRQIVRDAKGKPVMETPDHGDRNEVMLGRGKGCFALGPVSGLQSQPDLVRAATLLDANNDGRLDIFTGTWYRAYGQSVTAYPDRLFLGDGKGKFEDVTRKAGLLATKRKGTRAHHRPTYGVAHTDWDNDGDQDVLICAYGRQWNILWRNDGKGGFTDVAAATGFDGDEDRSGKHAPGVRRRTEPPFRSNGNTFDAAVADFDNDGDMDVFLAEICHWWAFPASDRSCILVNQGAEKKFKFSREHRGIDRKHAGRGWNEGDIHAGWLDFDNDGLLDLLLASSDYPDDQFLRLFRQKPDHTFEDVTAKTGFALRNPTQISLGDFDRDGDLDILVGTTNTRLTKEQREGRHLGVRLFRNDAGGKRHWLALRLEGKGAGRANRSAIGARVQVTTGKVTRTREVYGGQGHAGHQDAKWLHFGLGKARVIDELRIRWPDSKGSEQVFHKVKVDRFLHIRQDGQPQEWTAKAK